MSARGGSKDATLIIIVETLDDDGNVGANSVRMPMQLDTGAEINLCGASWVPMLELAGGVVLSHAPIEVGWVPKVGGGFSSSLKVTRSVQVMVGVVGFGWQNLLAFYIAPPHMVLDYLVCGWSILRH